ncbi:MAG: hypothetical protein J5971_00985 [Prevotella sp.]|nr:hypothetical protein [Prevotella sp.]
MNITSRPDALSLSGNLKEFVIESDSQITLTLYCNDAVVTTRTVAPAVGRAEIDLREICEEQLSFQLSDSTSPWQQTNIVKNFRAQFSDGSSTVQCTFRVVRGGVSNMGETAALFLAGNFMTWQPNTKPVTYYSPEFLTYYATAPCELRVKAKLEDETEEELTIHSMEEDECWTIPLQYAIVAGMLSKLPLYYDVWVQSAQGARMTYIQRYYAADMRSEQEQWMLFENSLGGIDTFRTFGDAQLKAEHAHNLAEINNEAEEYRVDTVRKYEVHTGYLDKFQRRWLLDFFPSTRKYICQAGQIRRVIVTESNVSYNLVKLPTDYSFTFRMANTKPLLNIERDDIPAEVLNINVPEVGSFTVAPRLAEFPRIELGSGALFPVQEPYSEQWSAVSAASLFNIFTSWATGQDGGRFVTFEDLLSYLRRDISQTVSVIHNFLQGLAIKGRQLLGIVTSTDPVSESGSGSDTSILSEKKSLQTFLRKDTDDTTDHALRVNGGITTPEIGSPDFVPADAGWRIYKQDGKTYLVVDNIEARGRFRATVLDIKRRTYSAGTTVHNMANGRAVRVVPLDDEGNQMGIAVYALPVGDVWYSMTVDERTVETSEGESETIYGVLGEEEIPNPDDVAAYKIDFYRADDEVTVTNDWHVGDMARCQEMNVQSRTTQNIYGSGTIQGNRRWWRLVTEVGTEVIPDGRECAYIVVSNKYDIHNEGEQIMVDDGVHEPVLAWSLRNGYNDQPLPGDDVVQEGNVFDPARQGLIVVDVEAQSYTVYKGIGSNLTGPMYQYAPTEKPFDVSPTAVNITADRFVLRTSGGNKTIDDIVGEQVEVVDGRVSELEESIPGTIEETTESHVLEPLIESVQGDYDAGGAHVLTLNFLYNVYRVVGDSKTRIGDLGEWWATYQRDELSEVSLNKVVERPGVYNFALDDLLPYREPTTENPNLTEGASVTVRLYRGATLADAELVDMRKVPVVFAPRAVFTINTNLNQIQSTVQGHTATITEHGTAIVNQRTQITQTQKSITTVAEDVSKLGNRTSTIEQRADSIAARVGTTETRLTQGNFHITANTQIDGDLMLKGMLVLNSTYHQTGRDGECMSPVTRTTSEGVSHTTIESVTVSHTNSSNAAADIESSLQPIVLLPMIEDVPMFTHIVNDVERTEFVPGVGALNGAQVSIRYEFRPEIAGWRNNHAAPAMPDPTSTYPDRPFRNAMLVCADPRMLSPEFRPENLVSNDGSGEGQAYEHTYIYNRYGAEDYSDAQYMPGCFVWKGYRSRYLLLMPGMTLRLVSATERIATGTGENDYEEFISWHIENAEDFQPITRRIKFNINTTELIVKGADSYEEGTTVLTDIFDQPLPESPITGNDWTSSTSQQEVLLGPTALTKGFYLAQGAAIGSDTEYFIVNVTPDSFPTFAAAHP